MSVGPISTNSVYASIPGAASLGLAAPASPTYTTVAGFNVLGLQGNGKPTNPPPTATTPNAYQQAYDSITTAANTYLQSSLGQGPSTIPLYAAGSSANAFAQLSTTLAALKTGLSDGFFKGTGFNALA